MNKQLINPNISIVICNYNYAHYISNAIESSINQSYIAKEIIVVDDGSTDDSVEVLKKYTDVVKLIQKPNGGQVSAYNEGIKHVTGDVVLFLDADDALNQDALIELSTAFSDGVVKVHYNLTFMDQDGKLLPQMVANTLDEGDCAEGLIKYGLLYNSSPASGNAYRVNALKQIFPLPLTPTDKHGADYFCIYGVALLGKVAKVDKSLGKYRVHVAGTSESLAYANNLKGLDLAKRSIKRWQTYRNWIHEKATLNVVLPENFTDFSLQKIIYCDALINANSLSELLSVLRNEFLDVMRGIFLQKGFGFHIRLLLCAWAVALVVSPGRLQKYLALRVCNPLKR